MKRSIILAASALVLFAAGCASAPPLPIPADFAATLADPARPEADHTSDANRKPADVMAFSRIAPGQTVFEMEAGSGYYTELFSRAVGPAGKVVMQSPKEFESFYKKDLDARLKDGRLANVIVSWSTFDKLDAADGSVDVVTWYQGPHEMWCKEACGNAPMGTPAGAFAEVARVLKPGGYFVVIDHYAAAGAPATTGNDLHRLDPAIVKPLIAATGLLPDSESALLANAADDHTKGVFDPTIRGKTDQYLLRYRKP